MYEYIINISHIAKSFLSFNEKLGIKLILFRAERNAEKSMPTTSYSVISYVLSSYWSHRVNGYSVNDMIICINIKMSAKSIWR